jgi:hypothetical protein
MAFQPFGYRFHIRSASSVSEVRQAIRSRKTSWTDPQSGARGWIAGTFICLWFRPFDRYGPMLVGRISRDDLGTKVTGRAGSDLNGLATHTILVVLLTLLLVWAISGGDYRPSYLVFTLILILSAPIVFWLGHKDRREAEPLVRFLRDATGSVDEKRRAGSRLPRFSKRLSINVSGKTQPDQATVESTRDALLRIGPADLLTLEVDAQAYIQTAVRDGGYMLEMRDGNRLRHYRARRRGLLPAALAGCTDRIFSFDETLEVLIAYGSDIAMPHFVNWEPMRLPDERRA